MRWVRWGWIFVVASVGLAGCSSSAKNCEQKCEPGALRCAAGADATERCAGPDQDGCFAWAEPVACESGQTCANGVCQAVQPGRVLTGGLAPAAGTSAAGGLQLTGVLTRDFDQQDSSAGGLRLTHGGLVAR